MTVKRDLQMGPGIGRHLLIMGVNLVPDEGGIFVVAERHHIPEVAERNVQSASNFARRKRQTKIAFARLVSPGGNGEVKTSQRNAPGNSRTTDWPYAFHPRL